MLLCDLPPHILDTILSSPNVSFMVISLYKCGSHALNYNLSNGGCTFVDLEDRNVDSMNRWPKMITTLRRLRTLKIDRCGYMAPPSIFSEELQKLPSSLTELSLRCEGAIASCLASTGPTSESSAPPTPPTGWPKSRLWNIGRLFPQLQSLMLMDWRIAFITRDDFSIQDISVLPPTLISLVLGIDTTHFQGRLIEKLLPELQTLDLFFLREVDVWPASLTKVHSISTRLRGSLDVLTAQLPRGLKSRLRWPLSPAIAASLPPGLEDFDVQGNPAIAYEDFQRLGLSPWPRTLPSRLTSLSVHEPINVNDITALPRSLTKLFCLRIEWNTVASSIGYHLAADDEFVFTLAGSTSNDPSAAQLDLTKLDASVRAFWPPHLKEIGFFTAKCSVKCLDWLPKSLTDIRPLQLSIPPSVALPLRLDELFPALRHLRLVIGSPIGYSQIRLPSTLHTLSCTSSIRIFPKEFDFESDDESQEREFNLLKANVPNLDGISCFLSPSLRDLMLDLGRNVDTLAVLMAGALPPALESLHFNFSKPCAIPPSLFGLLPPSLTTLGITGTRVSSEIFEVMPCVGLRKANLSLNPISRFGITALSNRFLKLHHYEFLYEAEEGISNEEMIELWPRRTMGHAINAGTYEDVWKAAIKEDALLYQTYPDSRLNV